MGLFSETPKNYEVLGKKLECQICGHDEFLRKEGQLNTALATFFKFDWVDPSAMCFICDKCGHIHWFMQR
jgi:hypothetical protein